MAPFSFEHAAKYRNCTPLKSWPFSSQRKLKLTETLLRLTGVLFRLTKVVFRLTGVHFCLVQFLSLVANSFDIWRKRLVYLILTIEQPLWRYALSSSNHMEWIIKTEPTLRWPLYTIFGKYVLWALCTETKWCLLDVYIKEIQGKICKQNNYEYQCRKKQFFLGRKWPHSHQSPPELKNLMLRPETE